MVSANVIKGWATRLTQQEPERQFLQERIRQLK